MHVRQMKETKGFTLIELLIVIAVIAILAAVAFVALDPLTRFRDARDAARVTDVTAILSAVKIDQVDNGGSYLAAITALDDGDVVMIVDGAMDAGCTDNNASCDTNVTAATDCVDLAGLVTEGYLADVPISPAGAVTWDDGDVDGDEGTGYTLQKNANGSITVRSCESENTTEISVSR